MKPAPHKKISKPAAAQGHEPAFRKIIGLIQSARRRVVEMKSHPKIGTAGELPFVVKQKHAIARV